MNRTERRTNQKAQETLEILGEKFLDEFTTAEDPLGPEIEELAVKLSSQWKNYCASKNFKKEAYELFDKYAAKVVGQYVAILNQPDVPRENSNNDSTMLPEKVESLEAKGWKVGDAEEFLNSTNTPNP
jgi:hypothetical protein